MSEQRRGRVQSEATKLKKSLALRGRRQPPELIAKRTAARGAMSEAALANIRRAGLKRRGLPNGRQGIWHHSPQTIAKILETRRQHIRDGMFVPTVPPPAKCPRYLDRRGRLWRFRSGWELDVARQLDEQEIEWAYEPHRILLSDGRVYVPDFWIERFGFYLEVKGRRFTRGIDKVTLAIADGHLVELLIGNDLFQSAALTERLALTAKGRP